MVAVIVLDAFQGNNRGDVITDTDSILTLLESEFVDKFVVTELPDE